MVIPFILIMCIGCFIFARNTPASEVYTYRDENGTIVITDQPIPEKYEKNAKKIDSYKRESPEEIRRFQQQQKNYERDLEARQRYNREEEENRRRYEAQRDHQKEKTKLRIIERKEAAVERIDDLNARKERLRAIENRDYNEARRLRLKDERRQIDRDIQKYKDIDDQ